MTGQKILVSGGTGFVGRFIVERLLAHGHEVAVFGRSPPPAGFFSAPVAFFEGALDPDRDHSAVFEGSFGFVHAAFDHVSGKYRGGEGDDPARFIARNRDGSLALFEAARRAGVQRAVFLSSRAVYGAYPPGTTLREDLPPRPDTLYGETKSAVEDGLRDMSGADFFSVSLRVTGVYGAAGRGRAHKWSGLFRDYLEGRPIAPRVASEVHGKDIGEAVRLVLMAPSATIASNVFNVSDVLVDRRDILSIVRDTAGCRHVLPVAADGTAVNLMATERLRALGWRPGGIGLFRETVAALAADPV